MEDPLWKGRIEMNARSRPFGIGVLLLLVSSSLAWGSPPEDDDAEREPLSAEAYVKALEKFTRETGDAESVSLVIDVVPDVYLLAMAKEYLKLDKSGYDEVEVEKRLTKSHQKLKKDRGKVRLAIDVETGGSKSHYFLQGKLDSHIKVVMGKKKGVKFEGPKPKPVFGKWRINELDTKRKLTKKLARIGDFSCEATTSTGRKPDAKDPIVVTLTKLRRYIEAEKRSEYERIGINVNAKQIALSRWQETEHPDVTVTILPGKWKMPQPPEKLAAVLAKLNPKK